MIKLLNLFISRIVTMPYIYDSEQFQLFIRSDSKYYKLPFRKPCFADIANKYKKTFTDLSEVGYSEQNEKIVNEGKNFFCIGLEALGKFERLCKINVDYFETFESELKHLMSGMNDLNKFYEEQYGSSHLEISAREVFSNPFFVLLD